jgi:hypothetical protein
LDEEMGAMAMSCAFTAGSPGIAMPTARLRGAFRSAGYGRSAPISLQKRERIPDT